MSAGIRVRRAVVNTLSHLGPDSRISQAVVRRACAQRGVVYERNPEWIALRRDSVEIRLRATQTMFAPYVSGEFDTFAASVDAGERDGVRVVDFSKPALHHYRQLDADFELPGFPEAIDFDDEYFRYGKPEKGSLVFDLGANVGLVTYALSKAVGPAGNVVAFEPDPTSLEYLRRNVERHDLDNVTIVSAAIADVRGLLQFFAEGTITSGLASTRKDAVMTRSMGSVIECEALTLQDAFSEYGTPAWIKMDIEGAEIPVLQSSAELLRSAKPFMVIDTSHVVGSDTSATRVERILEGAGFGTKTGTPGGSQLTWAAPGGLPK